MDRVGDVDDDGAGWPVASHHGFPHHDRGTTHDDDDADEDPVVDRIHCCRCCSPPRHAPTAVGDSARRFASTACRRHRRGTLEQADAHCRCSHVECVRNSLLGMSLREAFF